MKGIVLAAGAGTRLHPLTLGTSKQLLPVYDKPMIYYPISTLMLAGIRDVLVIVNPQHLVAFQSLLGDGSCWGISISFATQEHPVGLPDAFLLGEKFINGDSCALILGDNLFYGANVGESLNRNKGVDGAVIYCQEVSDPERYGVVTLDAMGQPVVLVEKPSKPESNLAVTGLYFFDSSVCDKAKSLVPSGRNELEMVDLLDLYLRDGQLKANLLERGTVWLDTGTFDSLAAAGEFVKVVEQRQGLRISCPEEVAWRMGYITGTDLRRLASGLAKSDYGRYLGSILNGADE